MKKIALIAVVAAGLGVAACGSKDNAANTATVDNVTVEQADDMLNSATANALDAATDAANAAANASIDAANSAASSANSAAAALDSAAANTMDAANAVSNAAAAH